MKQFLILILFLFLVLPVVAQEKLTEVDLRVNAVGSGTSYPTVIEKFGKPRRTETEKFDAVSACSGSAETHLTLFYLGLEITLLGDGKGRNLAVYTIEVTSPKWSASGVNIGAAPKDILAKFGEPSNKEEESGETVCYYVTKGNLGVVKFHFRNSRLIKIVMAATLC